MMLSALLLVLGFFPATSDVAPTGVETVDEATPARGGFRFEEGDRICLVGGALAERMQHHGWLETRLQLRFPKLRLSVRNLGFNADELDVKQRTSGFGTPDEYLTHCRADVIFAFFGFNESFAGEAGLEEFEAQLRDYIRHTASQRYNGTSAPRLVLFTPTSFEKHSTPNAELAAANNRNLELYSRAMVEIGSETGVEVVDAFTLTREMFATSTGHLTINGFHLSTDGNWLLSALIASALDHSGFADLDTARAKEIHAAVLEKNKYWFNRYRATDGFNVYGGRSALKYVDDLSNYTVLQRELEVLDAMAENVDREIWQLARGDGVEYPKVVVPRQIQVKTNKPGSGANGEHVFQRAEVAITSMQVPEGLKVELFADESQFPELVNPVQMAWDARGRLWVAVWPSYPHWRPGDAMDDKLLILEDTDGDGRADVCKTFASGLHNPTGFEFWMGGVFVGCAPDLLFLEDTDGDDRADRTEHVLGGLSSADTHHSANSFVMGQDGALYFQEGTFHMSQIESIYGPVRNRNGCVWRFEPRTHRVERYIPYNFANPHGHVFDAWGQDFMTDGTGNQNYYSLAFSGHVTEPAKHSNYFTFFAQNTRPAGATELLVSEHFPAEYQNNYLIANVIGRQGILRYEMRDDGSGFKATELEPLVMSTDQSFRPVDLEVAPDGSLYFLDWQNPIIGHMQHHLRDPSRDGEHGRVYRVRHTARPLLEVTSVADRPIPELLDLLKESQDRLRYRVRMELSRHDRDEVSAAVHEWLAQLDSSRPSHEHDRLEALWVLQEFDVFHGDLTRELLTSPDYRVRAAATRVLRQMRHHAHHDEDLLGWLEFLGPRVEDEHPRVRLEAVVALSFFRMPAAAELALRALNHPTDRFLDYAIEETVRELEPSWREALTRGETFAQDNPRGLRYTAAQLSTSDLRKVPGSEVIWEELLSRHELSASECVDAAQSLARLRNAKVEDELLHAIERADKRTKGHVDHLISNLFAALGDAVESGSPQFTAQLDKLARECQRTTTRRLTVVAQLRAGESVESLWSTASESLVGLVDLLDAASMVDDPALARRLFPLVLERFEGTQVDPTESTRGRFVRIELPGNQRTLTLAEVEVFHRDLNVARGGTATQSATNWGGVASRGIDGNKSGSYGDEGQTHTPENLPDPWWELDLQEELPIDRIVVWNRDEADGLYATRLDGFVLRILDEKRRTVFTHRAGRAALQEMEIQMLPPEAQVQRVAIPALAHLSAHDADQRDRALQSMLARFDDPWMRDEIVGALSSLASERWPAGAKSGLAQHLIDVFGGGEDVDYVAIEGRRLLALADRLAPELSDAGQRDELLRLRGGLGPRVIVIRPVTDSLQFDIEEFSVLAGRTVELIFENTDIMPHNLVVTAPGKLAEVGRASDAMSTQADAWAKGYIPELPSVLHHTGLLQPGTNETLRFEAPAQIGDYPYVCTFPGHWIRMKGVMKVVADPMAQVESERIASEAAPGNRQFVANWQPDDFLPIEHQLESRSAERGRELLDLASCLRCHRVERKGASTGPSLRETVQKYGPDCLLEHILRPSSQIAEGYQAEVVVLNDGEFLAGLVLDENETELHLLDDPYSDEYLVIDKTEIAEREQSQLSTMPDGLLTTFTRNEVLDLLAYLESLREGEQ